jgi:hypothetical protein
MIIIKLLGVGLSLQKLRLVIANRRWI